MSDLSESEKFILLKWLSMSISDKETMECLDDHWLWDAILTAEANSKLAKKELLRLYVRTGELPQQAAKEVFAKDTENWVKWCGERMYQKFGITRNDQLFWLKFKINRPKVKFVLEGDGQWSGSEEQEEKIDEIISGLLINGVKEDEIQVHVHDGSTGFTVSVRGKIAYEEIITSVLD